MSIGPSSVKKILNLLRQRYRGRAVWRGGANPYRTLIATILSAQTTDEQVDRIMPTLFRRYPTPKALAAAHPSDVEKIIKSVGLYKAKARHIVLTARALTEKFNGHVPQSREALMQLPGVGRKTANVVLIKAFGKSVMPVDTHVFRIANRIGLVHAKTPEQTEQQLERVIPKRLLGAAHHWFIHHGRTLCKARVPLCHVCPIVRLCGFASKIVK